MYLIKYKKKLIVMDWLKNYINNLRKDDILHQYISFILYTFLFVITTILKAPIDVAIVLSTVVTLAIGMGKEYFDGKNKSKRDFINDIIGTSLALLISLLYL